VEWDCQLADFKEHADHVAANLVRAGKSEAIRACYLVGCDGGHNAVRPCAGIPFHGETLDDPPNIVANIKVFGLDPNYWHFWTNRPIWGLTLQSMVHEDTWLSSTKLSLNARQVLPAPTLETLQRLFDERVGLPGIRFSLQPWMETGPRPRRGT
jgi:2-polyprenyl-6-methoxyphenol hydroxylase-like FAD-dependent oxidoreductase